MAAASLSVISTSMLASKGNRLSICQRAPALRSHLIDLVGLRVAAEWHFINRSHLQ